MATCKAAGSSHGLDAWEHCYRTAVSNAARLCITQLMVCKSRLFTLLNFGLGNTVAFPMIGGETLLPSVVRQHIHAFIQAEKHTLCTTSFMVTADIG